MAPGDRGDAEHMIALLVEEPRRQLSLLVPRAAMPEGRPGWHRHPRRVWAATELPAVRPGLLQFILGVGQQRARLADRDCWRRYDCCASRPRAHNVRQ